MHKTLLKRVTNEINSTIITKGHTETLTYSYENNKHCLTYKGTKIVYTTADDALNALKKVFFIAIR